MRVASAVAAGSLALLAALAIVLTDSKPRQAGSNYVDELGPVARIAGGGTRCQPGVFVPAGTSQVRILLATHGAPTPEVRVRATLDGRRLTSGTLPGGGREGHVDVPLDPVETAVSGARVCVSVRGPRTILYGSSGLVRLEWLRAGSESWLEFLPTVARRFGFGKANPFGSGLIAVAGGLLLVAWLLAARLLIRELRT